MPWLKQRENSDDDHSKNKDLDESRRRSTYDEDRSRERVEKLERPQDWPSPRDDDKKDD